MGSGINRFASTGRHLDPVPYSDCAKVHINGPKLHEADDFIAAAMHRRWPQTPQQAERGLKGPLNAFIHTSRGGQAGPYADGAGEVMERLLAEKSRFHFMVKTV